MTISTVNEKYVPISSFVFSFIIFWVLKFFVINVSQPGILSYIIVIILAVVSSFIYVLIDIIVTCWFEGITMAKSKYVAKYCCNIFIGSKNVCILLLKHNRCDMYINQLYFPVDQDISIRVGNIKKLKSRFLTLDKTDILYIYLYKYINVVVMSVLLMVIWQFYNSISTSNNLLVHISVILFVIFLMFTIYNKITNLLSTLIISAMKKRNLKMFTFR